MRKAAWWCAALAAAALAGPAGAEERDERAREFARLQSEMQKLFQEGSYEKGAGVCRELIFLAPHVPGPHYNLACALARLGRAQEALAALEMATLKGFNDPDHMRQDEDLASLRAEARFARCVEKARENARQAAPAYEPGAEVRGVRTVEGEPEGGLRYRLRLGTAATSEKPHRLVVWLHPAGGSMNAVVEPLSTRLASLGYALLVFTQKEWRFWSGPDIEKLRSKTLPEVAKVPGVDADRPVLMGYSAGGQAALALWQAAPGQFGGFVLDAAYPVRPGPGGMQALPLPGHPAVRRTPFYVLVGEKDPGVRVWRAVEPAWRRAGVPLTVVYVPDKGHTWLVGPKEFEPLLAWLEQLKAGKLPGAAPPEKPEAPKAAPGDADEKAGPQ